MRFPRPVLLLALSLLAASAVRAAPAPLSHPNKAPSKSLGLIEKTQLEKIRPIGQSRISVDKVSMLKMKGQVEELLLTETTPPQPVRATSPDAQACFLGLYSRKAGQRQSLKLLSNGTSCINVEFAFWEDLDGDGKDDLVVVSSQRRQTGSPLPIQVFTAYKAFGPGNFQPMEPLNRFLHDKAPGTANLQFFNQAVKQFGKHK
jgi:hypothetical protein